MSKSLQLIFCTILFIFSINIYSQSTGVEDLKGCLDDNQKLINSYQKDEAISSALKCMYSFIESIESQSVNRSELINPYINSSLIESMYIKDSQNVTPASGLASNTYLGSDALSSLQGNVYNTAIGNVALYHNSAGDSNTAIGASSMALSISGNNNVAIGYKSLLSNTEGNNNIAIGYKALASNQGSGNVAIGYEAGIELLGQISNKLYIGNSGSNLITGDFSNGDLTLGQAAQGTVYIANKLSVGSITDLESFLSSLSNSYDISSNSASIQENTSNISTNTSNISKNTSDISSNKENIAVNTTQIASIANSIDSQNAINDYLMEDYSVGISSAIAMGQIEVSHEGFSIGIGRGSFNSESERAIGLGYGGKFKDTKFILRASKTSRATGVGFTINF